jgi:hypothetical protein
VEDVTLDDVFRDVVRGRQAVMAPAAGGAAGGPRTAEARVATAAAAAEVRS